VRHMQVVLRRLGGLAVRYLLFVEDCT